MGSHKAGDRCPAPPAGTGGGTMRLDARIPVRLVEAGAAGQGGTSLVTADRQSLLVLLDGADGNADPGLGGGRREPEPTRWAGVRRIDSRSGGGAAVHDAGCVCCAGRSGLATALMLLFVEGMRGRIGAFSRLVLVVPPGRRQDVHDLLVTDPLVVTRYRPELSSGEN